MGVAGDRGRTDDIQFGKLKLYQLSYARKKSEWTRWGSNPRPTACKAAALPAELLALEP